MKENPVTTLSKIVTQSTTHETKPFYTISQARKAWVLVERIVDDVLELYSNLIDLEGEIELAECVGDDRAVDLSRRRLVEAIDRLQDCLEELEQLGVEMSDFKRGAVVFSSLDKGREIYLSWAKGEETVNYWYHRGQSHEERRTVDELEQRLFQFV